MVPKKFFKVGLYNAQSLNTCGDEFIHAVRQFLPDILAINESWLKKGCEALAPVVEEYSFKMMSRPRDVRGGRGGGLAFYIRHGIATRNIRHPSSSIEQWWLRVTVNGTRLALGTAYRPPWQSIDVFLDELTDTLSTLVNFDKIVLVGDFNINQLNVQGNKYRKFQMFLQSNNIDQVISEPTHFTDTSATLLDVICTDVPIKKVELHKSLGQTGHCMVMATLNLKKEKFMPKRIQYRPIKNIDSIVFDQDLSLCDWGSMFRSKSVDDMIGFFNNIVVGLFDKHAPVKKSFLKFKHLPWFTDNIKLLIALKNDALARYHCTRTHTSKQYYKDLKKQVEASIFYDKRAFFDKYINSNHNDPVTLWKNLKENILTQSSKVTNLPEHLNDPEKINENFLALPNVENIPLSEFAFFESNRWSDVTFRLREVDETEVARAILSIKSNAQGVDEINMDMILMTLPFTLHIITSLVNKSISSTIFPSSWKYALVTPIPKVNSPESFKDLRPISLLPFLSKVLERIVFWQLSRFVDANAILPDSQSGFRKGVGTSSALMDVVDNILEAQDKGKGTLLALLDFSRAFDSLSIPLLLCKLRYYGFDDHTLAWFTSYLTGRHQAVQIRSPDDAALRSRFCPVRRGVPQGSILGPLLFIIYTADITKQVQHCSYHLYADDVQIYTHINSENVSSCVAGLNQDLNNISDWATRNALMLNPNKSKYLILGSKKQVRVISSYQPKVSILGVALECVTQTRNLGILMDSSLRFEDYVLSIVKNCMFRLKVLYKIRNLLSEEVRLTLCESLVLSKLNYCDIVIGPCLLSSSKRAIQRVQNACIRYCYRVPRKSHITPWLNNKGLLNMENRRHLHLANFTLSIIKKRKPSYLYSRLVWREYTFNSRYENHFLLNTPFHRTRAFEGSFRYQATHCWNNLPPPLRRPSVSFQTLKAGFKLFLLNIQKSS